MTSITIQAAHSMRSSIENYLLEVFDSIKFGNPDYSDAEVEQAIQQVKKSILAAAALTEASAEQGGNTGLTTWDLARQLLECPNMPVSASIDISTGEADAERRIFTTECFGVNDTASADPTILFAAEPVDNNNQTL